MSASASEPGGDVLDGRTAAVLAVMDVLGGRRFASETLRSLRASGRLSGREDALAMEIAQGAVRHVFTIEHVLAAVARYSPERTTARVRAILCAAAYQVIWMDRIPVFAAADQAVELARRLVRGRAPTMVNAVLRRLTSALALRRVPWRRLETGQVRVSWGEACQFNSAVLPDPADVAAHLAAATGERPERYAELVTRFGTERAEAAAWASQALPAMVLQRNALRATASEFGEQLRGAGGDSVEVIGDAAYAPPSLSIIDTPVFANGLAFVQDTTAHAAALAVEAQPGQRVLDLCAAPGGKSIVLAMQMHDEGEVVACDMAPERLTRVIANVDRLGLKCVHARHLPAEDIDFGAETFDAALVDVPCSNTGVLARRPEARLGLTAEKVRSLVGVQRQLLHQAARHVRPGGRLVYSTCSVEPAENEGVVVAFVEEFPDWRLDVQTTTLPAWGPRWVDWRDGGYFARLLRA